MAELMLKIDPGSGYEDGDILCAFNRRSIRCCHAQHLCHIRTAPRNSSGLISLNSLSRDWFEATHQFRFERIDSRHIRRRDLLSGEFDTLSDIPNEKGEAIDVGLFIRRRKLNPDHYLFNVDGREIWYGGKLDTSNDRLDLVWSMIESKSEHRESQFRRWPAGNQEKKSHLLIPVDDFDDLTATDLVSSETNGDAIVRKRQNQIPWVDVLGLTIAEINRARDKSQEIDLRERNPFSRAAVVRRKQRVR